MLLLKSVLSLLLLAQFSEAVPKQLMTRQKGTDFPPIPPDFNHDGTGKFSQGQYKDKYMCTLRKGLKGDAKEAKQMCMPHCPNAKEEDGIVYCQDILWPPNTPKGYANKVVEFDDPNGKVSLGFCQCDNPAIRWVANEIVKGLPKIAEINCKVFMTGLQMAAKIGSEMLPGIGPEVAGAMWSTVDIVSDIAGKATNNQDAASVVSQWSNGCGSSTPDADKVFSNMLDVADMAGKLKPGSLLKGSGKKAGKMPPKPDFKVSPDKPINPGGAKPPAPGPGPAKPPAGPAKPPAPAPGPAKPPAPAPPKGPAPGPAKPPAAPAPGPAKPPAPPAKPALPAPSPRPGRGGS